MGTRFIDLHCDTFDVIARSGGAVRLRRNQNHLDIERLQKCGGMVQFFAIYIRTHDRLTAEGLSMPPYEYFSFCYDSYLREMAANADVIVPAMSYDDIMKNEEKGLLSSVLSIEDAVVLEGQLERVDELYQKGVRMMSLTWNYENSLAFPHSKDRDKMQLGLKPFGIEAVRRMDELGMIIDVSHLSDGGFYHVAEYAKKPFVASHSCSRALSGSSRCLTDEMLRILGDRGGVCGINFYAPFLREGSDCATLDDIVRHARHIADVAGIEAVALGSDFDGIGTALEFEDYTGMPKIAQALGKHFSEDTVDKICFGNALRVIRETVG